MLGDTAVGKSSLVSQFMTSEYLHAYDTSIGKCLTLFAIYIHFPTSQKNEMFETDFGVNRYMFRSSFVSR